MNNKINVWKMIIKGVISAIIWVSGIILAEYCLFTHINFILLDILIYASPLIYFFTLRSRDRMQMQISWWISVFTVILIIIIIFLIGILMPHSPPELDFYGKPVNQTSPFEGLAITLYILVYYFPVTFLAVIFAIIFSKPKKRTVKDE